MTTIFNKRLGLFFWVANICLLLFFIFGKSLIKMEETWSADEYSHGYLIPLIAGWLVWEQRAGLARFTDRGHWAGVYIVLLGVLLGLLGDFATLFTITQYAFIVTLYGLCLALVGWRGLRMLWFPLTYLIFMIPLPEFLYNNLSSYLQLISSNLGVAIIRFFDISVFLEGNVIDLGSYKLQVVEACSGLRYLFPLTSFGFLCSYFFQAKFWMRFLVFISTVPITVLMNSFRIGVIGILVDNWGTAQAEGFLHDFEGWVIFIGCLGILFFEMWVLTKLFMKEKTFSDVFVVGVPEVYYPSNNATQDARGNDYRKFFAGLSKPFLSACVLLLLAVPLTFLAADRHELTPDRSRFATFPLLIEGWRGVEVGMGQKYVDKLKFDDYIIANYRRTTDSLPINFYVAYYASQRQGASAHSPKSCIPGDGWRIGAFEQKEIAGIKMPDGQTFKVNRAMISKGNQKQLVYYWFQQRGRVITNEYWVKGFLLWDSLTRQRTDGALVRLVASLGENETLASADRTLEAFIRDITPILKDYIPE